MHKELLKEKQFNKKVELNIKISQYKKANSIVVIGQIRFWSHSISFCKAIPVYYKLVQPFPRG